MLLAEPSGWQRGAASCISTALPGKHKEKQRRCSKLNLGVCSASLSELSVAGGMNVRLVCASIVHGNRLGGAGSLLQPPPALEAGDIVRGENLLERCAGGHSSMLPSSPHGLEHGDLEDGEAPAEQHPESDSESGRLVTRSSAN